MAHIESGESLRFFDDWESDAIDKWLTARGYTWGYPTVCGSCCGFYEDEYWVALTPEHIAGFNAYARVRGIEAVAQPSAIRIGPPA